MIPDENNRTEPATIPSLRTAHVLFLDIVGYSLLATDEQNQAVHQLQRIVRGLSGFEESLSNGELICTPTGDGMAIVCFGEPTLPVRFARDLARRVPKEAAFALRMGLHSGPVYCTDDINNQRNVAGAGVNVAQRIMDCGDAGHILVSQSTADTLQQLSEWRQAVHDLGQCEVKHGLRLRVFNLFNAEFGNPTLPERLRHGAKGSDLAGEESGKSTWSRSRRIITAAVTVSALIGISVLFFRGREARALTATDTLILADFTNRTGDQVFDGTLREALSAYLTQSPFLSIVSDETTAATLKLMRRPGNSGVGDDTAREICARVGSRAYVGGSITRLGNQYLIVLRAVECQHLNVMARAQATAGTKEDVLHALENAGKSLRQQLGESLASLTKFSTPLDAVTTPSLEALRAYTAARRTLEIGDEPGSLPLYQWAVQLDPNFAMAYLGVGVVQFDSGETIRATENFRKAYELRDRVSEWEKFDIQARYCLRILGDLEQARQAYEGWEKEYPREWSAVAHLIEIEMAIGRHDRALEYAREASNLGYPYRLVKSYMLLDRIDEARTLLDHLIAEKMGRALAPEYLYHLAFLKGDRAEMSRQVAWAEGKSGIEDQFLNSEAQTMAYSGRIDAARELIARAVVMAQEAGEKEVAGRYEAAFAIQEALFGFRTEARGRVAAALKLSNGKDLQYGAALALAIAGDARGAQTLADNLASRYPADTIVKFICLPSIRATVAIDGKNYAKALEILQPAEPYELGYEATLTISLYAAYVRGEAYMGLGRHGEAAVEFGKVLSHRGIVGNDPVGALTRLGLARAYAGAHDHDRSRQQYEVFFDLWKSADARIPVLQEAQDEYRNLNSKGHL